VPVRVAEAPKIRENPVSFDDHFSQARLFWRSMSPVEKEHIVNAYAFELGKCYEQAIKERQLLCLARIDPQLCEQVAAGLGLPAPSPGRPVDDEVAPSPALSQVGAEWPPDGRLIGIVADENSGAVVQAVAAAGLVPLVIAAHGGKLGGLTVQRTFATARSVEFDALLLAAAPPPAPDALPARDAKAGAAARPAIDPRVLLLAGEAWRHAKAIAAWGGGARVLSQAGIADTPGVVAAGSGPAAFEEVQQLLAAHRVWQRFPATIA